MRKRETLHADLGRQDGMNARQEGCMQDRVFTGLNYEGPYVYFIEQIQNRTEASRCVRKHVFWTG